MISIFTKKVFHPTFKRISQAFTIALLFSFTAGSAQVSVGDFFEGGYVFYTSPDGLTGLVAASTDLNNSGATLNAWSNGSNIDIGATGQAIGDGVINTSTIIAAQGEGTYVAKLADDFVSSGYDDWFLPSMDELRAIYTNLHLESIGNFQTGFYWSSSEGNLSGAWGKYFDTGDEYNDPKSAIGNARAIREVQLPNSSANLIAYYPFNGNANDESGNANHATVFESALTTDRFGNLDAAYQLDGVNDNITGPTSNFPTGSDSRTIMGWMRVDAETNLPKLLFGYGSNSVQGQQFGIGRNSGNETWFWGHNGDLNGSVNGDNAWHHYAVTYNGTAVTLYLDGVLNATSDIALNTAVDTEFGIGTNWAFQGAVDDIRIYNRVLSGSEIEALYQETSNTAFITTWEVTAPDLTIEIAAVDGVAYDFDIDWGDGTILTNQTGNVSHTYATQGIKTVSITGDFPRFMANYNFSGVSTDELRSVEQWGDIVWGSMEGAFGDVRNGFAINAMDAPNLSQVTNMAHMFKNLAFTGGNLKDWDVSSVESMASMFFSASFNEDLSSWNVANVQNMDNMFAHTGTSSMGDISSWDVSACTSMAGMFQSNIVFNTNISAWNVANVIYMHNMFNGATSFNQDISSWDVSAVQEMSQMFQYAESFNQPIGNWNVSNVLNMPYVFWGALSFDQDLSSWDISKVGNFDGIFSGTNLSLGNYDNTLIGWASLDAGETQIPTGVVFGANGAPYCGSGTARNSLIEDYGWKITGDVFNCPGVVAYYPFNSNTNDESGNGYDAAPLGGASLATDRFGNENSAYYLDGVDGQIATAALTETFNTITVSTWFNFPEGAADASHQIVDIEGLVGLGINNNMPYGVVRVNNEYPTALSVDVIPNEWYHLVVTYDQNDILVYLNGELATTYNVPGTMTPEVTPYKITFGRFTFEASNLYNGLIDDVRIYNRSLLEAEVVGLYTEKGYISHRDILMTLYNSTDGANWNNNTNWGTDAGLSTWYGVTVENGNVTVIDMVDNNLVGALPGEIGKLSSLNRIELFVNQLSGTIPVELGQLENLTYLSLSTNQLSGEIPSELGNLSNLNTLYLSANLLTGALPSSIGNLSNLAEFSVSRNQLSGAIPPELANLSSAAGIYLYANQFASLPDLTSLPTGFALWVYDNKIGFEDIITNLPIATTGSDYRYDPQIIDERVLLMPTDGESLTLSTSELTMGTHYQWYHNNQSIEGATSSDYTFNFNSSLEGDYICRMTNDNVANLTIARAAYQLNDGINVAPTSLTLEGNSVDEQVAVGKNVGFFSSEDQDPDETQSYTLVSGEGDTHNAKFVIENRFLKTAGNIVTADLAYNIRVRVTDSGGEFFENTFIISVSPLVTCSNDVFTALSGTISDGSGDFDYNSNTTCGWRISLESGALVQLDFTQLDTESGYDFVNVYDGENEQSELLAQLSGTAIPNTIVSSTNQLYITLVSDDYVNGGGFSLDYSAVKPVAYYPFNGNADDASGNGYNGTVTGASLVSDRQGNTNAAYSFDGATTYIQAEVALTENAPFSLLVWVKWSGDNSDYRHIMSWWGGGNTYLGTTASSSELRFGDSWGQTGVFLPDSKWVLVTATYDGSVARIYLDGVLEGTSGEGLSYSFGSGLYIGRQGTGDFEYFDGEIDEVRIYDLALQESTIANLYSASGPKGLLAYLPFTNSSYTDFADNGFDAFQFGSSNTFTIDRTASEGGAANAYRFEEINADLLELNSTANLDFGDEITVMAWIRPDTYPSVEVKLISNVFEGLGFDLRLVTSDLSTEDATYKRKLFADITGISYGEAGEVLLDRWTHVAFRYVRGQGTSIFINGENLVTYGFVEGTEDMSIPVSAINVQLGNGYDGDMDEVKIFSSALSDDEILSEYNQNLWPFDNLALRGPEGQGDLTIDRGLDVNYNGSAYHKAMLIENAGGFQFRATPSEGSEAFMGDSELDGVAEPDGTLIDLNTGFYAVGFNTYDLTYNITEINSVGIIGSALTGDDSGWGSDIDLVDFGNGIYQISGIKLYDGEWKLRINDDWGGIDWGSNNGDGTLDYFGSNINISAGVYTITADLINNRYTVVEYGSGDVVAALGFDGNLEDESGYDNHGTSANATFIADRFGDENGAVLLGTNDFVNIGTDPELNLSNGFTMNMWINPRDNNNAGGLFYSVNSFHQHIYSDFIAWRYYQGGQEFQIEGIGVTAPTDTWTMFTWVYDGGEMRFYDDGLLVHTETVYGDLDLTGNPYEIGNGFDGAVDEFIWVDGVLSNYQISSLFNDGYVARYALDGNADDETSNQYHGTEVGGLTYGIDRFGNSPATAVFDGMDDYIDLGTDPAQHITEEITLSAWFKGGSQFNSGILSWSLGFRLEIREDLGLVNFGTFGLSNDILVSTTYVQDDNWHHAVGTYDGSTKRLYVDGRLEAEQLNVGLQGNPYQYEEPWTLGRSVNGDYFVGQIDDAGILDRAITAEEVEALYHYNNWDVTNINTICVNDVCEVAEINYENATIDIILPVGTDFTSVYTRMYISTGATTNLYTAEEWTGGFFVDYSTPVTVKVIGYDGSSRTWTINVSEDPLLFAYYPFDGDVLDYSGNGYDAEDPSGSVNFPSFTTDPAFNGAGESYLFNRTHTLTLSNTANYDFGDEVTVSAWLQPEIFEVEISEPEILSNLNGSTGFDFKLSGDPGVDNTVRALKADIPGTFSIVGELRVNEWHHVAFTFKRNDVMVLYIDGLEVGFTNAGDHPIVPSTRDFVVGNGIIGLLDDLKIFNRALSDDDIFAIYAENLTDLLPQVHSVQPSAAIPGSTVQIHGYNLNQPGTLVQMNGVFIEPTVVSNTQLEIVVPEIAHGPTSLLVYGAAGESNDLVNFTVLRAYTNRNFTLSQEQQISTSTEFRRAVDYADLDNDGDFDLVSGGQGTIIMNANLGGSFGGELVLASGFGGGDIYGLTTGDYDDDGDVDIIFSDATTGAIYQITNTGNGTNLPLTLLYSSPSIPYAYYLETLDFDSDGDLDVVSANFATQNITFLRNDGSDTFTSVDVYSSSYRFHFLDQGDIDGDGDLDLVYASHDENTGANEIGWIAYSGDGSGLFSQIISTNVDYVESVHVTDVDGNGTLDVVTGSSVDNKIIWLSNDGNGTFGPEQSIESNFSADEIVSGDLDGDGDTDLIAITFGSANGQTMFWYENLGNSSFSPRKEFGYNRAGASSVQTLDVDNDGDLDLAVAGYFGLDPLDGWVSVVKSVNTEAEILYYSFGIEGEVQTTFDNTNRYIEIEVPIGTDLTNLVATYTLSEGAVARFNIVGGQILQQSGISANDFTNGAVYNIAAEDDFNNSDWTINVRWADGLVVYYPFNKNTVDESGNGFDLTSFGTTSVDDRLGNVFSSYSFNGSSDYLKYTEETNLLGGRSELSLSFWVNPASVDKFQSVISFSNLWAMITDAGNLRMNLFFDDDSGASFEVETPISSNKWQHFVYTYSNYSEKIYLDGILVAEKARSNTKNEIIRDIDGSLYIGTQNGSAFFMDGLVDDIRLYNYLISESDIQGLFTEGGWPPNYAPVITANQIFTIDENSINGSVVGTVQASDGDEDALTFSIVAQSGVSTGAFAINPLTGALSVADKTQLDFETTQSFVLTVRVTDEISPVEATVTINLNDVDENVNQAPQIVANQSFSVAEDATNGAVYTVDAGDPEDDAITFTVVGDNTGGAFVIGLNDGVISLVKSEDLNFENITQYTFNVEVSDGSLTTQGSIEIFITDVNEAPVVDANQTFNIAENSANGTNVGTVTATDPEATAVTFAITGGNGASTGAFAIDAGSGQITVSSQAQMDFETTPTFSLIVEANDGELSGSQTVTINLTDVNEAPTISDATFSIDENTANDSFVGQIVYNDPENASLTFTINSGNGGAFAVGNTGILTVADQTKLDFETTQTFTLVVGVNDGVNNAATATITVALNDLDPENFSPTNITLGTNQIPENTAAGFAFTLETTDDDAGDTHTYSFVDGANDNASFTITNSTLVTNAVFNFEVKNTYIVDLQTDDGNGGVYSKSLTIQVTNVNEPTTFSALITPAEYELGGTGFNVGVTAVDDDGALNLNIYYKKASKSSFTIAPMAAVSDNKFTFAFSDDDPDNIGVEYYFEAKDVSNTATYSGDGSHYVTYTVLPATSAKTVTSNVTPGTQIANYTILAFPFQNVSVNSMFGEIGVNGEDWRLLKYNPSKANAYDDFGSGGFSSVAPGTGYWFIMKEANTIKISGKSVAITDGALKINLASGYNLFGNPFQGTLKWSDVIQHNIDKGTIASGDVSVTLDGWNGGWSNPTSLNEFQGAFVNATKAVSGFEIPTWALSNAGGRETTQLRKPQDVYVDDPEWDFRMYFETPSYSYSVGGIGMNPGAKDEIDYFDKKQLPNFSLYLDMMFEPGIIRSVKKTEDFKVWDFTVPNTLPEKYINLTWDRPVSVGKSLIFVDGAAQKIYDLGEVTETRLLNSSSAKHQLYFGDKDEIFANLNLPFDALVEVYPNPAKDRLKLQIYSTENKISTIEFISMDGRTMHRLSVSLEKGLNTNEISLSEKNFTNGIYFLKLDNTILTKIIKQ